MILAKEKKEITFFIRDLETVLDSKNITMYSPRSFANRGTTSLDLPTAWIRFSYNFPFKSEEWTPSKDYRWYHALFVRVYLRESMMRFGYTTSLEVTAHRENIISAGQDVAAAVSAPWQVAFHAQEFYYRDQVFEPRVVLSPGDEDITVTFEHESRDSLNYSLEFFQTMPMSKVNVVEIAQSLADMREFVNQHNLYPCPSDAAENEPINVELEGMDEANEGIE